MKQTLKINRKEFLDWRFSNKDELISLANFVIEKLNNNETVSIDVIWKTTGYIPINLIRNKNEINIEESDYLIDAEELYPEDFNIEWI